MRLRRLRKFCVKFSTLRFSRYYSCRQSEKAEYIYLSTKNNKNVEMKNLSLSGWLSACIGVLLRDSDGPGVQVHTSEIPNSPIIHLASTTSPILLILMVWTLLYYSFLWC